MKKLKYLKSIILLSLFFLSVFTCSKRNTSSDLLNQQRQEIDSLDDFFQSTGGYLEDPEGVKALLEEKQKSVVDSTLYHYINTRIAHCYYYNGQAESAYDLLRSAYAYSANRDSLDSSMIQLRLDVCLAFGSLVLEDGNWDRAIRYYQIGLAVIYENSDDSSIDESSEIPFHVNMANAYRLRSDYVEAIKSYRKSLNILLKIEQDEWVESAYRSIYMSLGEIYCYLKNYELADYYMNLVEKDMDNFSLAYQYEIFNSRAEYYKLQKEYDKMLLYRKKGYDISRSFAYLDEIKAAECLLGEAYLFLNQLDSAKFYMDKSADYFFQYINPARFQLLRMYANFYLKKNNIKEAERILTAVIDSTEYLEDLSIGTYHWELLEQLYIKKGDYRKAYEVSKEAIRFNDSLAGKTVKDNMLELSMRYQQDTIVLRKDVLIAQREQQVIELRSTNLIIILLSVVFLIAAAFVFYIVRRRRAIQYNRQLTTINALRMENVRNRVSPHYMLNVLNSVLPSLNKSEENVEPVKLLIQSVRGNLLVSEKMAVTLEEEIDIVKNYIALNQSMNPDTYAVKWNIATDVNPQTLLPSMIIQIPVENAIKYAFNFDDKEKENLLTIDISCDPDRLFISIQDNGSGFDPNSYSTSSRGTGSGLKILYKTVELLNIRNHQKMKFDIKNLSNQSTGLHGTLVNIEIPFDYKYEL